MNKLFALTAILIFIHFHVWAQPTDEDHVRANVKCARAVEEAALYEFKWTDSWLETKFQFVMRDDVTNFDAYATDKIRFQNEYGAWRHYVCICVWDAFPEKVKNIKCLKK